MLQFIYSITISLSFSAQPLCFQWFSDILFLLRKPYSYDFVTLDMKMLPKKEADYVTSYNDVLYSLGETPNLFLKAVEK
ncbi:hypothetical protein B6A10_07305 [Flavobacterium sp. L1I52]|uniref:Uncharacterized protein n=1 Tax=Flavobacterium pokkalii TaxID=1940408 RepID=A0ABR7UQ27_9FLAO|nr:hypothetical protein [Flavobacterium pokkalii]